MKYSSLKRQKVQSFRVSALDGGFEVNAPKESAYDNQVIACNNMWYKDSRLRTRPGFKADVEKAYSPEIYGYNGELEYKVTDSEVYIGDVYYRIATADIVTDDYAHYIYVYLIDLKNNITPIGNMAFLRLASDVFYRPSNVIFFSGKSQNGGIFALVTVRNQYNLDEAIYHIYEVNSDFTEWERVYDYYVPTIAINGRGNKYQAARKESGLNLPQPKTLESLNVLNGRFNAYFTSDGYSSAFKLPFSNISSEKVVCRIYYTLVDFEEWEIPAGENGVTKSFFGEEVTAAIDREKGAIYFVAEGGEFSIPVMELYNENNIKVTATKEIENGFAKIVHSTCAVRNNMRLLLSGGYDGNTVYLSHYNNPLYFPLSSAVSVGEDTNKITALSAVDGKVLAFKAHETFLLSLKEGEIINEVSLLSDNDKSFKENDVLSLKMVSSNIGCSKKNTVAVCNKKSVWMGSDNVVYAYNGVDEIIPIYKHPENLVLDDFQYKAFALADDKNYFYLNSHGIIVCDIENPNKPKIYFWEKPQDITVGSGFYHSGKCYFVCGDKTKRLVFVSNLSGDSDTVLYLEDGEIKQSQVPVQCSMTTKHYDLCGFQKFKNVDSIYLLMEALGKVRISVNDIHIADVNFASSNEDYSKCNSKTVKLLPHLYRVNDVYLTASSDKPMSIGEIEILYRVIG